MRAPIRLIAALAAMICAAPSPGRAAPVRAASLNLCTDELFLLLAAPAQIASLSYLSHNPHETPLWRQARRYPANDGSLLSVVEKKPRLILTMGGSGRDTDRLAARIGAKLVVLPYLMSLKDLKTGIGTVAAALGRDKVGLSLIRRIERLERNAPPRTLDTIWLGGKGMSQPATGLGADWMRLAGLRQRALRGDRVTLEQLVARPPAILLRTTYRSAQYSGDQSWLSHPVARQAATARTIATDGRRWTCMGPSLIPEIERIRREVQG